MFTWGFINLIHTILYDTKCLLDNAALRILLIFFSPFCLISEIRCITMKGCGFSKALAPDLGISYCELNQQMEVSTKLLT